ncbi:hypothetical protein B0H13DRAFT_2266884 [Mycena leptocephala]|nr:hypothetical protein B0H13DRAFT_2266884 [Mycena leptocephala]
MAFAFLSPDFFNVQGHDSSSLWPVLPATPRDHLARPAVPETSSFASSSSQKLIRPMSLLSLAIPPHVPAFSMDTPARYVPKSALARPRPPSHEDLRSPDWISEEKSPWSWIWNGRFSKVDSAISGTKQTTEKVVIVSIPGILTELVNHRRSWELDDGPTGAVCELLWDVVLKEKIALTSIVSVKKTAEFPYAFDNGKPALICEEGTQQLIHSMTTRCSGSVICVVGTSLPCGFCAFSGKPECEVHVRKKGPTTHVETNCAMVSAFNYKPAEQGSKSTPCRNVPVICKLCFPTYLDPAHPNAPNGVTICQSIPLTAFRCRLGLAGLAHEYSSPLNPGGTRLPHEVWESMKVEATEEVALGIPEASIPAVFKDVTGPDEGLDRSNVVGRKRVKKTAPGPSQRRKAGA